MDDTEDSLFEGMVLFNPTSSSASQLPVDDDDKHDDSVQLSNHREIRQQSVQSTTSAVTTTAGASFKPLDENLFSDLTVMQLQSQDNDVSSSLDPPLSPSSSSTSSRSTTDFASTTTFASIPQTSATITSTRSLTSQISSTRKKKRAGLRIGYGRAAQSQDSAIDADNSQPQSYLPSQSPSPVVVSKETVEPEEKIQQNQILPDSGISSESTAAKAVTSEIEEQIKIDDDVPDSESVDLTFEHKPQEEEEVAQEQIREDSIELRYEQIKNQIGEKNKELLLIALREAEADCDAIESKMQEALELQIVAKEECEGLLKNFAMEADHNADSVISNAKTKTSEEMEKWVSLSEALEVKKMKDEIESNVLSGARRGLDDSIEHIVKEDKQESEFLHKKKKILAHELQELLALVKQKEAEISENNSQIEEVEKKMAGAVSSFQGALSDINLKSEKLQSDLSQLKLENDDLSRKKEEIDDFSLQEEGRGLKIRELGRASADEAGVYQEVVNMRKCLIKFISKSREDKVRLATTEQKLFDNVQVLKQDISAVRASLQDLSSTKSGAQQSIESSKQRLLFIEIRVPEIESEKRVFATARNFKEAARIANEAKALYAEKETLQLKIEEDTTTLKKIEDDINHNIEKLEEKEENMSLMVKELETVRYQRLILLARAATAERSAALELGDVEEADILLKEAQAADLEAKRIQLSFKNEEFDDLLNSFISMELVSTLDKDQLAELAASAQISAP